VQPQVKAALLAEKARRSAVKAASDLAYALYDGKVAKGPSLEAFLAAHNLKTASLAPFTQEAGPAELGGSREVANAAFELSASRFYSEGLPTSDGAVVLTWKESLPSRDPLLAEVRAKVTADAIDNEKRKSFIEFGQRMRSSLEAKLKAGEAFDKAVAEAAGSVKVEVKSYPPFTLRTQSQTIDPSLYSALDTLEKGQVSAMQPTADKGLFVYAADKKAPSVDVANPRFMQVWGQLALTYSRTDSAGILSDVVDREVKRMEAEAK
jgi:peptidyl-prolyl cis-trans isomerase D